MLVIVEELGGMAAPPPTRWQADEYDSYSKPQSKQARQSLQGGFGGANLQLATDVDTASNAWKHVKTVIMDDGKPEDLFDLLMQSGKQAIDQTPAGVSPPTLLPISNLPQMIQKTSSE